MSTDLIDTSRLCVSVFEEDGLILLNFCWFENGTKRWLWEDGNGQPMYEIAEWFESDRLFNQINRLWANGVLNNQTAAGARSMVMWERDKCRMREIKTKKLGLWELVNYLFLR
jgi:hypothetical protein